MSIVIDEVSPVRPHIYESCRAAASCQHGHDHCETCGSAFQDGAHLCSQTFFNAIIGGKTIQCDRERDHAKWVIGNSHKLPTPLHRARGKFTNGIEYEVTWSSAESEAAAAISPAQAVRYDLR